MIFWDNEQIDRARDDFRAFLLSYGKEIGLPKSTPIQVDMVHIQNLRMTAL